MFHNWLRKMLHLDTNEAEVAKIKTDAQTSVDMVTAVLKRQGKLQEIMIKKTTTFYLAQGLGVLRQ